MTEKEYEDWVYKCLQCKHSYTKKDDAETMYCRLRKGKCQFEKYGDKKGNNDLIMPAT